MKTTRFVQLLVWVWFVSGCSDSSEISGAASIVEEVGIPTPPRDLRRASLELRATLALGVVDDAWTTTLDSFLDTESAWLDVRQREHFDVVQAMVGTTRAEAARDGNIARVLFTDLTLWRTMILREPVMETETLPGGMPDTLARLFEHSRIQSRTSMAGLDSDLRDLQNRLTEPALTANNGQLSLVETEMISLRERMISIHRQRLEVLPLFVQFAHGDRFSMLLADPAIQGWLLAYDDEVDEAP